MSSRDAMRAIIIDFEGRKGYKPHPDLIGIHDPFEPPGSRFYQVVLTQRLAGAAKAGSGHPVEELPAVMLRLIAHAEANGAHIVAFSQHELRMVEKYVGKVDPELFRRFYRVYRDTEVSGTLRSMHEHFRAGRKYTKLKKRDKRHWHDVLGHNQCDVVGTRELLLIATGAREWEPSLAAAAKPTSQPVID